MLFLTSTDFRRLLPGLLGSLRLASFELNIYTFRAGNARSSRVGILLLDPLLSPSVFNVFSASIRWESLLEFFDFWLLLFDLYAPEGVMTLPSFELESASALSLDL